MATPNGSVVARFTGSGSVAADGVGTNGSFAATSIAKTAKPDQPIEIIFRNLRRAVSKATAGRQAPLR